MQIGDVVPILVTFPGADLDSPTYFIGVVSDKFKGNTTITIGITDEMLELIKPKIIKDWGE